MSTTTTPGDKTFDAAAMSWLQGRLRWERILRTLHDKAEGTTPIVSVAEIAEPVNREPVNREPVNSEDERAA
jgi:hypothetical protein